MIFSDGGIKDIEEISDKFAWSGVGEFPLKSLEDDHFHGSDLLRSVGIFTGITSVLKGEDKAFFKLYHHENDCDGEKLEVVFVDFQLGKDDVKQDNASLLGDVADLEVIANLENKTKNSMSTSIIQTTSFLRMAWSTSPPWICS